MRSQNKRLFPAAEYIVCAFSALAFASPACLASATAKPASAAAPAPAAPGGELVAGPLVNMALQTSAIVTWTGRGGADVRCEIAGAPEAKVSLSARDIGRPEQVHMARVEGLKPGTAYTYTVTCGSAKAEGTFRTLPEKGSRSPLKIVTYGDPQTNPPRHAQVAGAVQKELPFNCLVICGDFCDDGNDWPMMRRQFFDPAGDLIRKTSLFPVRGNHENTGLIFRDLFIPAGQTPWYSFDAGNVHWVVLEQYAAGQKGPLPKDERKQMAAWLEQDLAASKADWKIVSYHEPTFNVGGHGSNWGRADILPILLKGGVDFILSGHSHVYERCHPIGEPNGKPLIQITSGGGGGTLYPAAPSPILAASASAHHYLVWQFDGEKLELTAKKTTGEVIDQLRIAKTAGRLPREIMDEAMTPTDAAALMKVFKVQWVEFASLPSAGTPAEAIVPAGAFPPGYAVTLEAASDCKWTVRKETFADCNQPIRLKVTPPAGVRLTASPWNGLFEPPLELKVSMSRLAAKSECERVPTALSAKQMAGIWPVPEAANVPAAPANFVADGKLDEWASVGGVPLPGKAKARSENLRLAWNKDGLCGALSVKDKDIRADSDQPAAGDCLELDLEMDNRRRLDIADEDSRAGKIMIYPLPAAGAGAPARAGVKAYRGAFQNKAKDIHAFWRKTDAGYDIEFFIPASLLAPAKMEAGQKIGFHHAVMNNGEPAETFAGSDKIKMPFACAFFWGQIRLAE
jgi:hypothetical protein